MAMSVLVRTCGSCCVRTFERRARGRSDRQGSNGLFLDNNQSRRGSVARWRCFALTTSLVIAFVNLARSADAQTVVDPTTAQFNASSDQNKTFSNGTPVLDHYELELYAAGATAPFQIVNLGKPAPDSTGTIVVKFSTLLNPRPAPGITYTADVTAVGPGGRGKSALSINSFSFSAPCSFTLSTTTQTVAAGGGALSVGVTAGTGCSWTATSNASWLTTASTGSGSGTVSYAVTANTSSLSRNATLTVGGQSVSVTQTGVPCSYDVSPTTASVAAGGASGSLTVTAPAGCAWTATSNASWLTTSSSGAGNGTATYTAAGNTSPASRSATLTIGGRTITITQPTLAPTPPANLRITSN